MSISIMETVPKFGQWNIPLPIHRRGEFLSDDGFQDFRKPFESAANDLLNEFDSMKHQDPFKSYRNLREKQLSGTDRACKFDEEDDKYKIVMDVEGFIDSDLKVKVAGPDEIVVEGFQEKKNGCSSSYRSFSRKFNLPGGAVVEKASSSLSSDNILTITVPKKIKEIASESQVQSHSKSQQRNETEISNEKLIREAAFSPQSTTSSVNNNQSTSTTRTTTTNTANQSIVDGFQITPCNSFFDDSSFENVRPNFQNSVREMMDGRNKKLSESTKNESFLKRIRHVKEDSNVQAHSITEENNEYKVVIDVHGFTEKDLSVRAITETELLVEGKIEKRTDSTSCSSSFQRRFCLPSNVDIKLSSTVLSSEGILTITIPKKVGSIDFPIPVRSEAASHVSKLVKKEQKRETKEINTTVNIDQPRPVTVPNAQNSQDYLKTLEETIESERKAFENTTNRERAVPVNLIEDKDDSLVPKEHYVPVTLSDDRTTRTKTNEHYVPVTLADERICRQTEETKVTKQVITDQSDSSPREPTTRVIPISLKGSFYNEPVFDEARKNVDNEMKDVFSNYKKTSSVEETSKATTGTASVPDSNTVSNRNIGSSTIVDDEHQYKIVVDVHGYEERELKVKITGVNEITIEGKSEKSKNGAFSKKSFQRSMQLLESVDFERTSTALSEEGILTITIPKKNQLSLKSKQTSPLATNLNKEIKTTEEVKKTHTVDSIGKIQDVNVNKNENTISNTDILSLSTQSVTSPVSFSNEQKPKEYIVPVSIDDSYNLHDLKSSNTVSTINNTSRDVSQGILSTDTSVSSMTSQVENKSRTTEQENKSHKSMGNIDVKQSQMTEKRNETQSLFNLPIESKGHFFNDSFFQDSRNMFETSLRDDLKRFDKSSSFVDEAGFYKSLRDRRLAGESQIESMSEDDTFRKIVLDVKGYDKEHLRIKVLSENEIEIQGEIEEKSGNSMSKRRFSKFFQLPGTVDLRRATSALSSDGVLNIKIPKKV